MKKAQIVIGLGFGDEGKGITTDFLSSKNPDSIVIRFSGGQQAAHTVKIGDKIHVHSSFGSGALRGLPSYFGEDCTLYPLFLQNEKNEIEKLGGNTELVIHPLAKVTTPFDIWHNRNNKRNINDGTCGKGVGATMKRNESPYKLFAVDLIAPESMLIEKLKGIAFYYGFERNEKLTFELNQFIDIVKSIDWNIKDYSFLNQFDNYIFEGSQGILLDMDHGIFPNVTYANTTSKNAMKICDILKVRNIDIYYVTRTYSTRHGFGWMGNESKIELINTEFETCLFNEFQKEFRYGVLDHKLLNYSLKVDMAYSSLATKNLVMTCLDQLDTRNTIYNLEIKFNKIFGSFSPESKDFRLLKDELSVAL